jgi:hypothetical protein
MAGWNLATTAIASVASNSQNRLARTANTLRIPRFSLVKGHANPKRCSGFGHSLYVVLGCSHKTNGKCCSSHLCTKCFE